MALPDVEEAIDDLSHTSSQKLPNNASQSEKEAFLSSFTAAEGKAIIRKVDRRFLLIIGMTYLIKNVSTPKPKKSILYTHLSRLIIRMPRLPKYCKLANHEIF
jgi:hypothetical protein